MTGATTAASGPGAQQPTPTGGAGRGLIARLRSRPILCLALLTPGIPEYLASSSPIAALVLNPVGFFFGLAVNVAQYTAGALLVREAVLRWGKGWRSAALLALAYGITEEGLGDNTLFRSTDGADGVLGHYGRFLGVNWLWSSGVLTYHVIFSIGLPIVLLGIAVPHVRGRSLLTGRGIAFCFASLVAATATESWLVWRTFGFWMGYPLLVGSIVAIAGLVGVAYHLPEGWLRSSRPAARAPPRRYGLVGFLLFPGLFALEYGPAQYAGFAVVSLVLELALIAGFVRWNAALLGDRSRDHDLAWLALGAVGFLALFGVLITLPVPYTLPLAVLAVVFCWRLVRASRTAPGKPNGGANLPGPAQAS